jgi:hypothetical protein
MSIYIHTSIIFTSICFLTFLLTQKQAYEMDPVMEKLNRLKKLALERKARKYSDNEHLNKQVELFNDINDNNDNNQLAYKPKKNNDDDDDDAKVDTATNQNSNGSLLPNRSHDDEQHQTNVKSEKQQSEFVTSIDTQREDIKHPQQQQQYTPTDISQSVEADCSTHFADMNNKSVKTLLSNYEAIFSHNNNSTEYLNRPKGKKSEHSNKTSQQTRVNTSPDDCSKLASIGKISQTDFGIVVVGVPNVQKESASFTATQQQYKKSKSADLSSFVRLENNRNQNENLHHTENNRIDDLSSMEKEFADNLNFSPSAVDSDAKPDNCDSRQLEPKSNQDARRKLFAKSASHLPSNVAIEDSAGFDRCTDPKHNYYDNRSLDKYTLRNQINKWNDKFASAISCYPSIQLEPKSENRQNPEELLSAATIKSNRQRFAKKKPAPRSHSVDESTWNAIGSKQHEQEINRADANNNSNNNLPKSILKNAQESSRRNLKRQDAVAKSLCTELNHLNLKNFETNRKKTTSTTTTASSQSLSSSSTTTTTTTTTDNSDFDQSKRKHNNKKEHCENCCTCNQHTLKKHQHKQQKKRNNFTKLNLNSFFVLPTTSKLSPLAEHQNYSSDDSVCGIPKSTIK